VFGLVQIVPAPLFEPLAGVDIQPEAVSSVSRVILWIPLTRKLRTSVTARMLPDDIVQGNWVLDEGCMSTGRAIAMIDYKTGDRPSELLERAIIFLIKKGEQIGINF
jgi:hypothetical protein